VGIPRMEPDHDTGVGDHTSSSLVNRVSSTTIPG
jgi:hypothetical protein